MRKYTKEWAEKMLELNPEWTSIFLTKNGECKWCINKISTGYNMPTEGEFGYLGLFEYDGDWKDTLVVRKCNHSYVFDRDWEYCPKCGELLGSK